MKYYEINEETARLSHNMMSMTEYKPGSATAEYRASVDAAAELVERQKKHVSPFYHDKLDGLLERYARRLAKWTDDHNRNGASCPSVLICGPVNFPTRKKEKQNARAETLWREYGEIKGILDKIKRVGSGPIDPTDPHAREMLTEQLHKLEEELETAKAINAFYRRHKTMKGFQEFTDETADKMDQAIANAPGSAPYPNFKLNSIRGKIKRTQENLEKLDKLDAAQNKPDREEFFDGGRIVHNIAVNRLQIFFDEIPGEETRNALKKHGFHWSPKNQAWQRQLTQNAVYDARCILNIPPPTTTTVTEKRAGTQAATPTAPVEPDTPDGQALFPLA